MKVICAWCKKDMGEKEPFDDKSVSHGMCEDCFNEQMGDVKMEPVKQCRVDKLTDKDLARAAEALEIDPKDYPELLEGTQVELEHCSWTEGDAIITMRIALDHLREDKSYYSKLKAAGL